MNRFKITTLMLLFSSLASRADTVVVPASLPNGGGGYVHQPSGLTVRYQELFPASQFGTDPGTLHITQFAWREGNDGSINFDTLIPSLEIRMSTTSATTDSLSPLLDANVGRDQAAVFPQSSYLLHASSNPTGTGPFDIKFPLAKPFTYNPAQGNLLIDLLITSPGNGQDLTFGSLNDAGGLATISTFRSAPTSGGPVTEFTFSQIPEPGTCALMAAGLLTFVFFNRR